MASPEGVWPVMTLRTPGKGDLELSEDAVVMKASARDATVSHLPMNSSVL